jgi:hypothetical protein
MTLSSTSTSHGDYAEVALNVRIHLEQNADAAFNFHSLCSHFRSLVDSSQQSPLLLLMYDGKPKEVPRDQEFLSAGEQRRFEALQKQTNAGPETGSLKPMAERGWRQHVPVFRDFEYWRLRAAQYPHIERADQDPEFFLRGITCHPRLSDFPTCKDVISDYFHCKDSNRFLQMFNICAPIKEQMSACINEVFVRNSHRTSKKTEKFVDKMMEERRERRLQKIKVAAAEIVERKDKLAD